MSVPSSFVDTVTQRTLVGPSALITYTVSIPDDYPEVNKADLAAFAKNLPAVPQINAAIKDAWSLT